MVSKLLLVSLLFVSLPVAHAMAQVQEPFVYTKSEIVIQPADEAQPEAIIMVEVKPLRSLYEADSFYFQSTIADALLIFLPEETTAVQRSNLLEPISLIPLDIHGQALTVWPNVNLSTISTLALPEGSYAILISDPLLEEGQQPLLKPGDLVRHDWFEAIPEQLKNDVVKSPDSEAEPQ